MENAPPAAVQKVVLPELALPHFVRRPTDAQEVPPFLPEAETEQPLCHAGCLFPARLAPAQRLRRESLHFPIAADRDLP